MTEIDPWSDLDHQPGKGNFALFKRTVANILVAVLWV